MHKENEHWSAMCKIRRWQIIPKWSANWQDTKQTTLQLSRTIQRYNHCSHCKQEWRQNRRNTRTYNHNFPESNFRCSQYPKSNHRSTLWNNSWSAPDGLPPPHRWSIFVYRLHCIYLLHLLRRFHQPRESWVANQYMLQILPRMACCIPCILLLNYQRHCDTNEKHINMDKMIVIENCTKMKNHSTSNK